LKSHTTERASQRPLTVLILNENDRFLRINLKLIVLCVALGHSYQVLPFLLYLWVSVFLNRKDQVVGLLVLPGLLFLLILAFLFNFSLRELESTLLFDFRSLFPM